MKRGLGLQGPAVLAAPRRAPEVLTGRPGDRAVDAGRRAAADRRRLAVLVRDLTAAREDLAEALDGWEAADQDAAGRVAAIRSRHGLGSDLTSDSGKS